MTAREVEERFALPLTVEPLPWEDLASRIVRAADRMGYERVSWIVWPRGLSRPLSGRNLLKLSDMTQYRRIAAALQLPLSRVHELTLHHFASLLQEPAAHPTAPSQPPIFSSSTRLPL